MSFRRIEEFLSRSADDVRNQEAYGSSDSDRHCPHLKKGQLKIENGERGRLVVLCFVCCVLRKGQLKIENGESGRVVVLCVLW